MRVDADLAVGLLVAQVPDDVDVAVRGRAQHLFALSFHRFDPATTVPAASHPQRSGRQTWIR
ncbi:hypothetical protein GCM10028799_13160 [Kribbella italica]